MFISLNRYGQFAAHDTAQEAVAAAMANLDPIWSRDAFWVSDDGESIHYGPASENADFTLAVYASLAEAVEAGLYLDEEALAFRLWALALVAGRYLAPARDDSESAS